MNLLKVAEVQALTRRSRTIIYRDMAAGRFPRPVKLGRKSVAWIESEVTDWLNACIAERA